MKGLSKKKKSILILLFIAGFFSLSLIGITQNTQDTVPKTDSVAVSEVAPVSTDVNRAEDAALNDQQAFNAKKGNILDMKRSSGFKPVTLLRGLLGLVVLILISFLFSTDRRAVNWGVVGKGLAMQLLLAVGVLYVPFICVNEVRVME